MNYCSYYILRVKVYNQTFKAADAGCAFYAWAWSFGGSGLQIFVAQKIHLLTICRFLRGINQVSSNYIILYNYIIYDIIYIWCARLPQSWKSKRAKRPVCRWLWKCWPIRSRRFSFGIPTMLLLDRLRQNVRRLRFPNVLGQHLLTLGWAIYHGWNLVFMW